MNLNPELQRQFYLEYSAARGVGVSLVLWLIFTLTYYIDDYQLGSNTARVAFILYLIITLLWGGRQCIDSILEEFREQTWNIQRLSALEPWSLIWGKLFGSTMMVWYAGLICLGVYALATPDKTSLPIQLCYFVLVSLLVQSSCLILGQLAAQRGQTKTGYLFLLLIIGFFYISPKLSNIGSISGVDSYLLTSNPTLLWYRLVIDSQQFYLFSLILALCWSYVGNFRLMQQELGIRTLPWVWLVFNLYAVIYLGGFFADNYAFAWSGFVVSAVLTYIGVLITADISRRSPLLLRFLHSHAWQRFIEEMPLGYLSFLLAIPFSLQLSLFAHPLSSLTTVFHVYPLAMLILLLRDCSLYFYFSMDKNPQGALNRTLLTLALLYAVIPAILSFAGLSWLATGFFPLWADSATVAALAAGLQMTILAYLLFNRCTARLG